MIAARSPLFAAITTALPSSRHFRAIWRSNFENFPWEFSTTSRTTWENRRALSAETSDNSETYGDEMGTLMRYLRREVKTREDKRREEKGRGENTICDTCMERLYRYSQIKSGATDAYAIGEK